MKTPVAALSAALLFTGVLAAYQWRQLRDEREQNANLLTQLSALQAAQAQLQTQIATPTAPVAPLPQTASGKPRPGNDQPQPALPRESNPQTQAALAAIRAQMDSPEGRAMNRANMRMLLPTQYPDLARELNLSPAQVDKLFDMLARQQSDRAYTMRSVLEASRNGATPAVAGMEMARKEKQMREANDAELQTLLGDKYPAWQAYNQALPERRQVKQLQAVLGSTDDALGDAQAKPLIAALAAEQGRIRQDELNSLAASPQDFSQQRVQRAEDSNRRLADTASAYLTPQQLDSYKHMLDRQLAITRTLAGATTPRSTEPAKPAQ